MRISDWSSDVCSSDLEIEQQVELCLAPVGSVPGPRDAQRDGDPFDALRSAVDLVRPDHEQAQRVVDRNQREEPARGEPAVRSEWRGTVPAARVSAAYRGALVAGLSA